MRGILSVMGMAVLVVLGVWFMTNRAPAEQPELPPLAKGELLMAPVNGAVVQVASDDPKKVGPAVEKGNGHGETQVDDPEKGGLMTPVKTDDPTAKTDDPEKKTDDVNTPGNLQVKPRIKIKPNGHAFVNFAYLADFEFEAQDPEQPGAKKNQIPEKITKLHERKVTIEGHMIPLEVEKGMVKAFILSRYLMGCCFGNVPKINEWVVVRMPKGETTAPVAEGTIVVTGMFEVGEVRDETGYVVSLFRMKASLVTALR